MGNYSHLQFVDYFRILAIIVGFGLIGFILSAIIHASEITKYYTAWRWFLVGQSLIVLFVISTLQQAISDDLPWGWRLPLVALAFSISLVSLRKLYNYKSIGDKNASKRSV